MITYRFGIAGSLEKILPQAEPTWLPPEHMLSGMRGETVSLQIGYTVTYRHLDLLEEKLRFFIRASEHIKSHLRREALMPVRLPCYADHDQDYLTLHPAMLPDLLLPYEAGGVRPVCDQWRALWIDLLIAPHCPAGNTTLEIPSATSGVVTPRVSFAPAFVALSPKSSHFLPKPVQSKSLTCFSAFSAEVEMPSKALATSSIAFLMDSSLPDILSISVNVELMVAIDSPPFPFALRFLQRFFILCNLFVNTSDYERLFLTIKRHIFGGAHMELVQTIISIVRVGIPAVN